MPNIVKDEPVLSTITTFVAAAIGLLVAFGVALTAAQIAAIGAFVVALYGVGVLVRNYVWTPKSVANAEAEAFEDGFQASVARPTSPPSLGV